MNRQTPEAKNIGQAVIIQIPDEAIQTLCERVSQMVFAKLAATKLPDTSKDELLTTEEAAQFLRVSEEQLYQWCNRAAHKLDKNPIPFLKAGRCLRFSKDALKKWMETKQ